MGPSVWTDSFQNFIDTPGNCYIACIKNRLLLNLVCSTA